MVRGLSGAPWRRALAVLGCGALIGGLPAGCAADHEADPPTAVDQARGDALRADPLMAGGWISPGNHKYRVRGWFRPRASTRSSCQSPIPPTLPTGCDTPCGRSAPSLTGAGRDAAVRSGRAKRSRPG
jgi:hypothetical protein